MTFNSAHSGPGRKLVTLTDTIRVCKRGTGKLPIETAALYENVIDDESLEPAKGLEPPTY
jgi:hypothetical protein